MHQIFAMNVASYVSVNELECNVIVFLKNWQEFSLWQLTVLLENINGKWFVLNQAELIQE